MKILTLIGLMSLGSFWAFMRLPMNVEHPVRMTVLERYQEEGGYKRAGSPILVLRLPDGRVIDKRVSWATYHLYPRGSVVTFMESQQTLGPQTTLMVVAGIFVPSILGAVAVTCFLVIAFRLLFRFMDRRFG